MSVNLPYNANFSGTVSASLFVSNQVLIAPVAAGTTSTLTVGSFSSTYLSVSGSISSSFSSFTQLAASSITALNSSITQSYASTLSFGTILGLASGSLGTNLSLSGTLTAISSSVTQSYASTLSFGTILGLASGSIGTNLLLSGTLTAISSSITQSYASTLSFGTILGLASGSIGTNLLLSGTLTAASGSVTQAFASTLSIGTILNFLQGQTVSTAGTTSGTFIPGTFTYSGGGSFSGTVTLGAIAVNQPVPAFPLDVSGSARITVSLASGTVNAGSLSSVFANFTQAYSATLSVGTILNFSAGGSVGTNLALSGTLSAVIGSVSTLTIGSVSGIYSSSTQGYTSTLSVASLSASISSLSLVSVSSLSGTYGSFMQSYISTLSCSSLSGTYGSINTLFTGTHLYNSLSGIYSSISAVSSCGTLIAGVGTLGVLTFGSYIGVNIAPSYPLDIAGTARITGNTIFANMQNAGSLSAYTSFGIGAGGSIASTAAVNLNVGSLGTPYINFDQYGINNASLGLDPSDSGKFKVIVGGSGTFGTAAARLTITNTGLIGIATTSPAFTLDVNGSQRITGSLTTATLSTFAINGTSLSLTGVGTVPGLASIVGGSGSLANQLVLQGYSHPTPASIVFNTVGASANSSLLTTRIMGRDDGNGGGILAMQTNLTERLTILNNGYIGIANATPSYPLDISGNCRVTGTLTTATAVFASTPSGVRPHIQNFAYSGAWTSQTGVGTIAVFGGVQTWAISCTAYSGSAGLMYIYFWLNNVNVCQSRFYINTTGAHATFPTSFYTSSYAAGNVTFGVTLSTGTSDGNDICYLQCIEYI